MTSYPYDIAYKAIWICQIQPESVYDIGIGFGSFGVMVREYTDIQGNRWHKNEYKTQIMGCEIYEPYVKEFKHQDFIYNHIDIGDIYNLIQNPEFGQYDLIHAGDVIEHLPKVQAQFVLDEIPKHCKNFILSIPIGKDWADYRTALENPAEGHQSFWLAKEFTGFHRVIGAMGSIGQVNTYWWRY